MSEASPAEQLCYVQNFEQFRSLNTQMNHVPVLAMTLTGGLWFGAGVTENLDMEIRFALIMLAGFSNLALILIVYRIRDVLESYLERIEAFHPASFAGGKPTNPQLPWLGSYSMITIFCTLMMLAAIFSFISAFWTYWPFAISRCWGVGGFVVLLAALYLLIFNRSGQGKERKKTGGANV
ncbi:MAG: hypothetical protein AMXMBFR74_23610 [Parvibaculum sp.]|uniref:hypothetical protein n=1 Tax=Parvibaculum sp. TaxID=2024848 RepID=UPI0035BB709C